MSNKKEQTAEKLQTEKLEVGSGYRVADGVSLTSSRGILAGCDIAAKDLGDNASFEALVKSGHIVKK
ncbi:MAG: hypothetical protein U5M23_01265 [Marinagarivorans sp.]|nr:hypothetical protein [Marinagarivorans sp.]